MTRRQQLWTVALICWPLVWGVALVVVVGLGWDKGQF